VAGDVEEITLVEALSEKTTTACDTPHHWPSSLKL
jgi:hypothetical protein